MRKFTMKNKQTNKQRQQVMHSSWEFCIWAVPLLAPVAAPVKGKAFCNNLHCAGQCADLQLSP